MLVDPDDRSTWPRAVGEWVAERAERLRGTTDYAPSLRWPDEEEDEFRALFTGVKIRAYHSTRLLDHEIAAVREQGLRLLTRGLVEERIEGAFAIRAIDRACRDMLLASNTFAQGGQLNRENQVCLSLGRRTFDEDWYGVESLLSIWGGEGIYMSIPEHVWPLFKSLGRPAIVVAAIDLSSSHRLHHSFAALDKVFIGIELGLKKATADVFYREPVPARDVLAVWHPGDPNYDLHSELPQD